MEEKEKKEVETVVEDEKIVPVVKEEEKKSETDDSKKDDFEKKDEVVPTGKYNAAVRKQRELELANKELEKKLAERNDAKPTKKEVIKKDEEEDDDFDEEDEELFEKKSKKRELDSEIIEPISKELKDLRERVERREADDKKNQRTAFFKRHPEYLTDSEKWQELLDTMDSSLNPNSKEGYYKQLTNAHRLISGESVNPEIEKKKMEIAAEIAATGDGSKKAPANKSDVEDRSQRLAKKMPKGYEFEPKE